MKTSIWLREIRRRANSWFIITMLGALVIIMPVAYVVLSFFQPTGENWEHIKEFLLADYVKGSVILVGSVGFLSTTIGLVLAWIVAAYEFPLRKQFKWLLIIPLAIPPYIAAYTYSTMTSYTGVIQSLFRNYFDYQFTPGTIEIMSLRGAVFVLTLFLYPYVYMIALNYFEKQSASYIESAKTLGLNGFQMFFRLGLPIARPAIIAGSMLVIFEVLSDYGVASFFGVRTISTAIFQTWFGMYDINAAMRLAAWLLVIILGIFMLERFLRKGRKYDTNVTQSRPLARKKLRGWTAWLASLSCSIVFFSAFLIPFVQLIYWSLKTYEKVWRADFITLITNSLVAALIGALIISFFAILAARTINLYPSASSNLLARIMTSGYAVPGAVVAIGVLALFITLDEKLAFIYPKLLDVESGSLVLSMSIAMLITGYVIRFMAQGFNSVESGYTKVPPSYREASFLLGRSMTYTFWKVEFPLLRGSILIGFALAFLEIMKELPLTLLLRPFNFDTLATRTYQYAIDERIYEAAPSSLLLICLSILSVIIILRFEEK
ncbi:iron ABC transporter [Sporosarcina sp. P18a]|uniref:ABC transporter permease n=1 Tax=unclassified Sporosarcina TaxID=2647733 RepID=UPI000C1693C1|nr:MULTISPECIES: iron ABC transporter permease [unclassified Sporosarcina]PIC80245.1 iron ABC transporter [Sporosarcina sp. P18a]PID02220.1 iron ABC transporter [Sporosarcina sp. P2]